MFFNFLNAYITLIEKENLSSDLTKTKHLTNTDIRIYIVPFRKNSIAQFLANYDDIYCR